MVPLFEDCGDKDSKATLEAAEQLFFMKSAMVFLDNENSFVAIADVNGKYLMSGRKSSASHRETCIKWWDMPRVMELINWR